MSVDGHEQRAVVLDTLRAFASLDSEIGRTFARTHRMHPTDATAIVEILNAERDERLLTPARLASRIGLTTGATSTLLGRLEAAGHITRRHDHADRRVVSLHSTPAIHDSAAEFFAPFASQVDDALAAYSAADLEMVRRVVASLQAAMVSVVVATDGR